MFQSLIGTIKTELAETAYYSSLAVSIPYRDDKNLKPTLPFDDYKKCFNPL